MKTIRRILMIPTFIKIYTALASFERRQRKAGRK